MAEEPSDVALIKWAETYAEPYLKKGRNVDGLILSLGDLTIAWRRDMAALQKQAQSYRESGKKDTRKETELLATAAKLDATTVQKSVM